MLTVQHVQSDAAGPEDDATVSSYAKEGTPEPATELDKDIMTNQHYKVLIVEDTIELAEVIAATLERVGFITFHETHVEHAIAVYQQEHPDIILLDIGLPDKTGWKLIDTIKELEDGNRPAIIMITAHGDPANRLMGKLQGVYSYLVKPFTPDEIEHVVAMALQKYLAPSTAVDGAKPVEPLPDFMQDIVSGMSKDSSSDSTF